MRTYVLDSYLILKQQESSLLHKRQNQDGKLKSEAMINIPGGKIEVLITIDAFYASFYNVIIMPHTAKYFINFIKTFHLEKYDAP